jgi:hypothetical protein
MQTGHAQRAMAALQKHEQRTRAPTPAAIQLRAILACGCATLSDGGQRRGSLSDGPTAIIGAVCP